MSYNFSLNNNLCHLTNRSFQEENEKVTQRQDATSWTVSSLNNRLNLVISGTAKSSVCCALKRK